MVADSARTGLPTWRVILNVGIVAMSGRFSFIEFVRDTSAGGFGWQKDFIISETALPADISFYPPPDRGFLCSRREYGDRFNCCQVIYSQFGLAIHQNDHQERRRFVEWAQNEIAFVPDFHKRILFSDEAHFWLNGYVNKQNCRIWSEANPQVYVETPLHPEKLTVWCALWAGGILLQKR
ncbi:putative DD41D transposase [Trichonephila clavipes]|nr:putative DD41D transposase [Trichonephila clavipes]